MKTVSILFAVLFFVTCGQQDKISTQNAGGLQKIDNATAAQIEELVDAGAEIIVREPDYIIVRGNMTTLTAFSAGPVEEQDLIQRLIHVYVPDTTALQTVINSGVDFWHVDGDTAVARAFDIYISDLKEAELDIRIVAQDANAWLEGLK